MTSSKMKNADVIEKKLKWKMLTSSENEKRKTENADVIKKLNLICIYLKN